METCEVCGDEVLIQIRKGTGVCSNLCEKAREAREAASDG